ncbi:protein tyrosine/serine phosphatase [Bifidobacterium actinocoloniiforme DSM 22766]|uniref:Protein tyrosine/serine phosphatase n=1 Tax=Bifidobacterium actinocoloniiforme DSM 22766 TaxID=1437605 RepID=A0A086YZG8_9BIFI|nr:tyrosine-protein phosphatase [Bifidobacterium actinocoloniiforme]AKV54998.1 hypothetical protein AB656_00460 [Bifidobacterium actinocoloniiforme DSM 22766]KFI39668.1 protein tyrosine/serine phosphatase [Bifidobacterium actinocoloniiforme DSM 22766]
MDNITRIDGLYNFRDLGGMETDSGHIASGLLYRSEALAGMSEQGRRQLEDSPVALDLDLRSDQEARLLPDPEIKGVERVHIEMLDGAMPEDAGDIERRESQGKDAAALLRQTYLSLIAHNGPDYARVVHRTAQAAAAGKGTLIHCSAGKDRTGTSIAFILTLAGARREQVVADYASSQANLSGAWQESMLAMIERAGVNVPESIRPTMVITPPALIEEILDKVEREYGSVAAYLLANGGHQEDIDALRQALRAD